jgi:hypothetical protein
MRLDLCIRGVFTWPFIKWWLLKGIDKNGFKISLEDIENSLPEFKGDYEIGSDGKVFLNRARLLHANAKQVLTIQFKEYE